MMRGAVIREVLFLGLVLAAPGCGTEAQILRETSAPVKPSWIMALPPDSSDYRYFVGVRTGASTLEEGTDAAVKDATGRIAGFLRSRIRSEFEETTTQVEQNLRQQISARSAAVVSGAKLVDWYYEKTARVDQSLRVERYDVYVLVGYPKDEVSREIVRQDNERTGTANRALESYRKGLREEADKRFADARNSFLKAADEAVALEEAVPLRGDITDTAALLRAAKEKASEMLRRSRRIALRCQVTGGDEAFRQFSGGFRSAVGGKAFEVADEDPAYELVGDISLADGGIALGNKVVYGKGSLELKRIGDGRTVTVIPLNVKGFHKVREMASLNAIREGGRQAGELATKAILAQESGP